jgi:hypothetical protein
MCVKADLQPTSPYSTRYVIYATLKTAVAISPSNEIPLKETLFKGLFFKMLSMSPMFFPCIVAN